jgi:hypothetical protein
MAQDVAEAAAAYCWDGPFVIGVAVEWHSVAVEWHSVTVSQESCSWSRLCRVHAASFAFQAIHLQCLAGVQRHRMSAAGCPAVVPVSRCTDSGQPMYRLPCYSLDPVYSDALP